MSPSFMFDRSSNVEPVHSGPIVLCVNVFLAMTNDVSMRPVVSLMKPFLADTDQNLLFGLWFHCQTNGNAGSFFFRVNSSDCAMPGIKLLLAGRFNVSGTLPPTPKTGQPSSHFTGTR